MPLNPLLWPRLPQRSRPRSTVLRHAVVVVEVVVPRAGPFGRGEVGGGRGRGSSRTSPCCSFISYPPPGLVCVNVARAAAIDCCSCRHHERSRRCFRRWAAPVTGCQLRSIRKGDARLLWLLWLCVVHLLTPLQRVWSDDKVSAGSAASGADSKPSNTSRSAQYSGDVRQTSTVSRPAQCPFEKTQSL